MSLVDPDSAVLENRLELVKASLDLVRASYQTFANAQVWSLGFGV